MENFTDVIMDPAYQNVVVNVLGTVKFLVECLSDDEKDRILTDVLICLGTGRLRDADRPVNWLSLDKAAMHIDVALDRAGLRETRDRLWD